MAGSMGTTMVDYWVSPTVVLRVDVTAFRRAARWDCPQAVE